MQSVQKYKNRLLQYGTHFLLLLIFWGGMLRKSFNCDTLSHMVEADADVMRYLITMGVYLSDGTSFIC